MTTDVKPVTFSELKEMFLAVIDRYPDHINPMDSEHDVCWYTAEDPEAPYPHCIVGQLAADQGWRVPPHGVTDFAHDIYHRYGWPLTEAAATFAYAVQIEADRTSREDKPWSSIRRHVAEYEENYE